MRLIDADSLLECVHSLACETNDIKTKTIVENVLHVTVPQIIEDEPTIDAQPVKRGRWSECWRDPMRNVISVICSACEGASLTYLPKRDLAVEDVPKKICVQMPYCPKCGAYMRGEKDERVD